MPRIALIANPGSGSSDEIDIAARLAESGADVEEFPIERAADAADCGAERIVVAGGDGSIAPAATVAARLAIELAVIPSGTANDFADRMGLPSEIDEALMLAVTGTQSRRVDLARLGERPFVNVAGLGLAPAAADAAADLKDKLGALAYAVGALRAATTEQPLSCRVLCGGTALFEGQAWQVMIGCTGAFGGGSRIEADADDGQLDVVVIEAGPRATLAKRAIGLRRGDLEAQEGVRSSRGAEITVSLEGPEQLNVDGELVDSGQVGGDSLRFSVEPSVVRLVIG